MDKNNYFANTQYIGKSGLDLINRSPKHYWARYLDPYSEGEQGSDSREFGHLAHTAILEPDQLEARYVVVPPDMVKNGNAWKEWKLANDGKGWINASDYEAAMRMRDAVYAHPSASEMLRGGVAEQPLYATDPETGVLVKCKPDYYLPNYGGAVIDLKTTRDASPAKFARDAHNYRYHVQDAFYTDVAIWAGKPVADFVFIAIEKEPPYAVAVYAMDSDSRELGRIAYREDLRTYAHCLKTGVWESYAPTTQTLSLPSWAFK